MRDGDSKLFAVGPLSKLRTALPQEVRAETVETVDSELALFLGEAGLEKVAEGLGRCHVLSMRELCALSNEALKDLKDPSTGTEQCRNLF